ncbi:RCC1 domain-containing protein [Paenibacillus flagellatus]|nr:hypothetical protein [Paenibacillus flagellatus]
MCKRVLGLFICIALLVSSQIVYAAEVKKDNTSPYVVAGVMHSIQLEKDGTVWSFGRRPGLFHSSQVGKQAGGALEHIKLVSTGYAHSAALDNDGRVWMWGENKAGQLGQGDEKEYYAAVPVRFEKNETIRSVSAGYDHTLALTEGGNVWAWGSNRYSQLGDGSADNRNKPIPVKGNNKKPLDGISAISAGFGFSLALTEEGEVWTWGNQGKTDGRLQKVTKNVGGKPVPLSGIVSISAGFDHALALDRNGTLYAWGLNRNGQLGVGSNTIYSLHAVEVKGLPKLTSISAGSQMSAAIDEAGNVWSWGVSYRTDLKKAINRFQPMRVTEGTHFIQVSVGDLHGMAVDEEDQVWVWGNNEYGQLGHATAGWSFNDPVVKRKLDRGTLASVTESSASIEKSYVVDDERVIKLTLQLKDNNGKLLYQKWPTAEAELPGREPIVAPFKLERDSAGKYTTELRLPQYYMHTKIKIRVDHQTIVELIDESP